MLSALLREYGPAWVFHRARYSARLKLLRTVPALERLYEKPAPVRRWELFSFDIPALRAFLRDLPPELRQQTVDLADRAACGVIDGFSALPLDYGQPIDWQKNPLTGKSCDIRRKWYRIPDFDPDRGDIKLTWEINRFTHFWLFSRAWLLTDDERYYRAFATQLADWLAANPYPCGANYKCGQECALRLLNTLIAAAVFRDGGLITEQDEANLRELVRRCYKKIRANFYYAHRCIKNNHTLSELTGMVAGAWCCEDAATMRRAWHWLEQEIRAQFFPDGGYRQFSFNYQRFALQIGECALKIAAATGHVFPADVLLRLQNSAELMYQCQNDDGDVPNYGSNDGALIFPMAACGYRDFRPALNTIHALTAGTRLYPPGPCDEELLWFGGTAAPVDPPARRSCAFPDAGLFTLRRDNGFLMLCLNDYHSRPAHQDQLHLDLWWRGCNVLCDSGTYSYASELGRELAATGGHNTALTAVEQMNAHGNFLILDWTQRLDYQHQADRFCGSLRSRNGYTQTRAVELTADGFRLCDRVDRDYELLFHTPCEVRATADGLELLDRGQALCRLCGDGQWQQENSERSLFYLQTQPLTRLHFRPADKDSVIQFILI